MKHLSRRKKMNAELTITEVTDTKNYPVLSGSEKQVEWANQIRSKYFNNQKGELAQKREKLSPEKFQARLAKVQAHYSTPEWTQAKTWIDARHDLLPYG
jgi:hypothetical protein